MPCYYMASDDTFLMTKKWYDVRMRLNNRMHGITSIKLYCDWRYNFQCCNNLVVYANVCMLFRYFHKCIKAKIATLIEHTN